MFKTRRRMYNLFAIIFLVISTDLFAAGKTVITIWGGMMHFRGAVTEGACAVSTESENKSVMMGQVNSAMFSGVGEWAASVPFNLTLTDCDTSVSQQVGVMFSGVTDGKDPLVFSSGQGASAAKGIGLGIFDNAGELMVPNTAPQTLTNLTKGVVTLPFTAKYRATSYPVTPGNANALVWFFLYYP